MPRDHIVVRGQRGIDQLRDGDARDTHRTWRRDNMRQEFAAHTEAFDFIEIFVGVDRGELQNLVEGCVSTRRLGVVKNETHHKAREESPQKSKQIAHPYVHRVCAHSKFLRQPVQKVGIVNVYHFIA